MQKNSIEFYDLGLIGYQEAFDLQNQMITSFSKDSTSGILFLEHPSVVTVGRNCDFSDLTNLKFLESNSIDIVKTTRGGKITAHMPGQLVVYPILNLYAFKLSPKKYVALLEESIREFLALYNINSYIDPQNPGVWVDGNKIAAIGIQFKDHYSMHGLAININNDLNLFNSFVPCGIKSRGVTNLSLSTATTLCFQTVKLQIAEVIAKNIQHMFNAFKSKDDLLSRLNPFTLYSDHKLSYDSDTLKIKYPQSIQ